MQKPSGLAWALTLDGLTRLDGEGNVQPSLADRWSSDANNSRWQFHLRANVLFHDGHPLTSLAVIASLTESCRIASCPWTGLHAVGASVVVTADTPIPDLPTLLAQDRFRIQALNSTGVGAAGDALPVGTGPFHFTHASGDAINVVANEEYWRGRPFLDAVEISSRAGSRDAWSAANSSGYDLIELRPGELRQAAQQHASLLMRSHVSLVYLQIREESLASQLRAAAALSLDRSALAQVIFQKQAEITASLLPAQLSGYSFLFSPERDLTRAQVLRGGATPPALTLAAENSELMQLAAARIALNLHDAGFTVRLLPPLKESRLPNADITLRSIPLPSGESGMALHALLRQFGQPVSMQINDSAAAWRTEQEFLERHTMVPLLYLPRAWSVSPRLRDLQLGFDGNPDLANTSLRDAP